MTAIKSVNDTISRKRIEGKNGVLVCTYGKWNRKMHNVYDGKKLVAMRLFFWENVNQIKMETVLFPFYGHGKVGKA